MFTFKYCRRVRCHRFSGIQHNVRDIGVRPLLHDGHISRLVAPRPGLLLLRHLHSGDALHHLQRDDIMVTVFPRPGPASRSISSPRGESLFMMLMYVVYCVVLHFNPQLERWAHSLPVPCGVRAPEESSGLVTYRTLDEERGKGVPNYGGASPEGAERQGLDGAALNRVATGAEQQQPKPQNYYVPKEHDPSTQVDPLVKPVGEC